MLIPPKWQPLSCSFRRRHFIGAVSWELGVCAVPIHSCRIWFRRGYFNGNLQKKKNNLSHAHSEGRWLSICAWVFTLPPAHIRCHQSSNQQPCEHDWIINQPINASLHSVRLSTSKYLPMQNNPWRLDHHFKLSLCTVHNQAGADEWGETKSSAPSPNFHADSQTSYAFGCGWGACEKGVRALNATKHHSLVDLVYKPLSH